MASPGAYPTMTLGFLAVLLAAALQGCATADSSGYEPQVLDGDSAKTDFQDGIFSVRQGRGQSCCAMIVANARQQALVRSAIGFLGRPRIEVNDRRFTFDCSGLARGVYLSQGIDLYEGVDDADGPNGVRLIYRYVKRHGRLHHGPTVHPGDLVFFHNTWDFNGDGRLNDLLTHVGVVARVEHDGTVVFVSRVSGGIERYRMNLRTPTNHRTSDGRVLNDFMRKKRSRDPHATQYLTAELFAAFGTLIGA